MNQQNYPDLNFVIEGPLFDQAAPYQTGLALRL